jgi:hypothetical protein
MSRWSWHFYLLGSISVVGNKKPSSTVVGRTRVARSAQAASLSVERAE